MESVEFMANAGFRPGSRSTFVSAKVDKAIDTQFGHIGWDGRAEEERTNSLCSNKARRRQRASDPGAEQQVSENRMERQVNKTHALEIIWNDYSGSWIMAMEERREGSSLIASFKKNVSNSE